MVLEGAQAGLSWITILKKRENYRQAFHDFDCEKVANYKQKDIERLLANPGIIRNKLKISSAIRNAKAVLKIKEECGSLDTYFWAFVNGKTIQNNWKTLSDIPVKTELSDLISHDLKKRGLNFVGSTIVYAFMQATGMVNDHVTDCFRYQEIKNMDKKQ